MSRKKLFTLLLATAFLIPNTPATAVRNGQVTQTGKYVIPVHSAKAWCSGVAITTRVVITNGHCTRKNNQVFTDIKVGHPGSNQTNSPNYIKVIEVITEANFTWNDEKTVPKDDIAFLILESDLPSVSVTRVATEADILEMRSKGEVLLLQGYGLTGEGPIENFRSTFPSNGYFSIDNSPLFDPTLQSISSKSSSACNGDSGAPVIWENGTDAVLLGVNVGGGGAASNCRKASADGIFRTEVQIPSRHSSILVNSIVKSSPTVGTALKSAIEEKQKLEKDLNELRIQSALVKKELDATKNALSKSQVDLAAISAQNVATSAQNTELQNQSTQLAREIEETKVALSKSQVDLAAISAQNTELQDSILELKSQVQILTKYATTTLTCIKKTTIKKVTGINPVCPAGYKKK
jgi:hypothetical protein